MTIRVARLAAPVLLAMMAIPSAAAPSALMISDSALDLSAAVPQLPTDRPERQGAIIILVSFKRPPNLQKAAISTFIVDYPPGASAMLHRTPTSRYVLVPVLAGSQTMHHRAVVCYGDPFAGPFSPARAEAPPPREFAA